MASKLALALVIGGTVASSVGAAFKTVENGIQKLEAKGNRAKVLKSTIGETIKLQKEWKRAHDSGAAGADKLLRKLNGNLDALRNQGVEVGRLGREYQRLAREAKSADLQIKGRSQIGDGVKGVKAAAGQGLAFSASLAVPTKVSGDYQARIRQMALWAHIAGDAEEQQMADKIAKVAANVGMGQQALAAAVGGLIEKGIDWQESVDYAPLVADLIDGQGMEGETIATLFSAFKEAGVKKEDMGAMLGQVAAAGDIGAFGPKDMARYMPSLLGTIKTLGMEGPEAVRFLGASLQSQYKQTQDSASAATNMNNLLNAVISSTSQERFAKQGIDLAGSIAHATKTGTADNPVEAFIKLTDVLLKEQSPAKFKEVEALKQRIKASADGSAEEAQAMASLLQSAGLAGIVSDQSASAGLLAQIKYGSTIKEDMATIKATDGKAKIEQDAEKSRETSNAKWGTAKAAAEASMTRLGDAIRPLTDRAADGLASVSYGLANLAEKAPAVALAIAGIGAALIATKGVLGTYVVAKGAVNVARGSIMGWGKGRGGEQEPGEVAPKSMRKRGLGQRVLGTVFGAPVVDNTGVASKDPQRVFVVNADAFGRIGDSVANRGPARAAKGSRRSRRRERRRATRQGATRRPAVAPQAPRALDLKPRPLPAAASAFTGGSGLGKVARSMRGVTRLAKRMPGGNFMDAGAAALDVALNATTQDEKAEGYGAAGGSLAGTLAGAAAGAAVGSIVPVIGTAIGGAIGAYLGGMGGESVGAWLGKRWFGEEAAEGKANVLEAGKPAPVVVDNRDPVAAPLPAPAAPALGDAVRSQPKPSLPAPVPLLVMPVAMPAPREPMARAAPVAPLVVVAPAPKVAQSVPVQVAPQPVPRPDGLGDVVRDMAVKAKAPAPRLPEPARPAKATPVKAPASKVDQSFTFSPSIKVDVHGDVKEPDQVVREIEAPLRRLFEDWKREAEARMATVQLYDQPHV